MDLPCLGESELVSDGREDFDNREGSFMFRGELGVCDRSLEISGFQPDLVAFGEGGESLIVVRGHDLVGELMCSEGFVLSGDKGFKVGFHCGDRRVGN